jgi:hypothetical protein
MLEVEPLHGNGAQAAARLLNFATSSSALLDSHRTWLDLIVVPRVRSNPKYSYINLTGHASRSGNAAYNLDLSLKRCYEVQGYLNSKVGAGKSVVYKIVTGKGESESGDIANDNSPVYRSVELFLFENPPPPETRKWLIYKQTLQDVSRTTSPSDRDDPPGLAIGQNLVSAYKDIKRVNAHPLEMGDPDWGDTKVANTAEIPADYVMRSVDKVYIIYQHQPKPGPMSTVWPKEIERSYTYTYGPGAPNQKVRVTTHKSVRHDGGRVDGPFDETITVDQPSSYIDP